MLQRLYLCLWALAGLALLAACGSASQPQAAAPTARAAATAGPPTSPAATTAAPPTSPAATAAAGELPESLTPEGYHVRGQAGAPATLVMYSDFL